MTATVTPIKNETFSLESPEFATIKKRLNDYFARFYENKRQMPPGADKKSILKKILSDETNFIRVLHEYEMGHSSAKGGERFCIDISPPVELQQYTYYISKYLSVNSSLKEEYTLQGKLAESSNFLILKHILHYCRINVPMLFNEKSLRYGGDGGYDFHFGKFRLDSKHRDEGTGHGLLVNKNLVNRNGIDDDVILIHNTNSGSFKQGSKINKDIMDLSMADAMKALEMINPISMVGWTTFKRFKEEKNKGNLQEMRYSYCMDDILNIKDLIAMIVEDQIDEEDIFG